MNSYLFFLYYEVSKPFYEAQDLQSRLLQRIGAIERTKEVGPTKGRVERLKQLGNAQVPQILEIIGLAIMEVCNAENSVWTLLTNWRLKWN